MSSGPQPSANSSSFSFARVLTVLAAAAAVILAVYVVLSRSYNQESQQNESKIMAGLGFVASTPLKLDEKYTDANGDMVADVPSDPARQITPDKLIFSYIAGPDADRERGNWQELVAAVSTGVGKPVEMVAFKTNDEQIHALESGQLHLTGFNTGAVPEAVTSAGFVPVCVAGGDDGKFGYTMQFIVPTSSAIKDLQDLRRHTIAFTDRTSNSGYKAAVVLLKDHELLPQRDYNWRFSMSHDESIKGIASGEYEVASVASERLQHAIATGDVEKDKFKIIYESERFPPATLGYVYNLSPEIAEKIKAALLAFAWNGTAVQKQFAGTGATKFVPVSYKNDFALIRRIGELVQDPRDVPEVQQ